MQIPHVNVSDGDPETGALARIAIEIGDGEVASVNVHFYAVGKEKSEQVRGITIDETKYSPNDRRSSFKLHSAAGGTGKIEVSYGGELLTNVLATVVDAAVPTPQGYAAARMYVKLEDVGLL